ncbi:MAG: beta-ketoacyl-ACP synthase II [Candidatus Brocadiia bacterium]
MTDIKRVVVTGIGAVTPMGNGVAALWDGLLAARSCAGPITLFDASQHKVKFACCINNFQPHPEIDPRELRRMDRYVQFAMSATIEAFNHAGLAGKYEPERAGTIIASGIGGIAVLEEQHGRLIERGPSRVSPLLIPMMIGDIAAGMVAMRYNLRNVNFGVVSACASGAHGIGEAYRTIKHGYADVVIAGGAEAGITPLSVAGFGNMNALSQRSDDPLTASRPFDRTRDGFVIGEGAGILILEELEHAKARGANILAEIVGYGHTADAHHITDPAPDGAGARSAMALAISEAGLTPDDVDYVNAHGTSTIPNDRIESLAINNLFKRRVQVSSTKSMIGHLLGASGAVELIISMLAIRNSVIPPTINYREKDPECDIDCVPNTPRQGKVRIAISNSFGFGGHNACLAVKAFEE